MDKSKIIYKVNGLCLTKHPQQDSPPPQGLFPPLKAFVWVHGTRFAFFPVRQFSLRYNQKTVDYPTLRYLCYHYTMVSSCPAGTYYNIYLWAHSRLRPLTAFLLWLLHSTLWHYDHQWARIQTSCFLCLKCAVTSAIASYHVVLMGTKDYDNSQYLEILEFCPCPSLSLPNQTMLLLPQNARDLGPT